MGFLLVPTATFRVLYFFLVLVHERRKVLHFNITDSREVKILIRRESAMGQGISVGMAEPKRAAGRRR